MHWSTGGGGLRRGAWSVGRWRLRITRFSHALEPQLISRCDYWRLLAANKGAKARALCVYFISVCLFQWILLFFFLYIYINTLINQLADEQPAVKYQGGRSTNTCQLTLWGPALGWQRQQQQKQQKQHKQQATNWKQKKKWSEYRELKPMRGEPNRANVEA